MSMQKAMMLTLAAALMGGCAGAEKDGPAAPEQDRWVLQVENHNWQDATVYAVTDGTRQRIGMVTTNESERFTLPQGAVRAGELRLMVRLIGSASSYLSPPILVTRGATITFDVENHLPMSSHHVMARRH